MSSRTSTQAHFSVCFTTRAMSKRDKDKVLGPEITLSDSFLAKDEVLGFGKVFPSREKLKIEQGKDATLSPLFEEAVSEEEIKASCGYFRNDGVLMGKWTSLKTIAVVYSKL